MLRWEELQRDRALSYFITDLLPVADNKSVTGSQKTAGCAKIGCFCSFQSSGAAINLPFYSLVLRGQEEKFLLPLVTEKCMHSKDAFTLRVRRAKHENEGYYKADAELEKVGGKRKGFNCTDGKMET